MKIHVVRSSLIGRLANARLSRKSLRDGKLVNSSVNLMGARGKSSKSSKLIGLCLSNQ